MADIGFIDFVGYLRLGCLQDRQEENTGRDFHPSGQSHPDRTGIAISNRDYFCDNFIINTSASPCFINTENIEYLYRKINCVCGGIRPRW